MRTQKCSAAALAVMLLGATHESPGDVLILLSNGAPAHPSEAHKQFNAATGGWNVYLNALYMPGGDTIYEVHGTGGETIDNIYINVPCWTGPNGNCVPAGSPVTVRVKSMPPHGLRTVHNIIQTNTAETLLTIVNVDEDLGKVVVEHIGTITAGRDVHGPITGTTDYNPVRGVTAVIAGRDIRGNVTAEKGRVGLLSAGRHIGTAQVPILVRSRNNLFSLEAGGNVYANIDATYQGGTGYLWRMSASRFEGTLKTRRIGWNTPLNQPGFIKLTGAMAGLIEVEEQFNDAAIAIELPAQGLTGQIIFNAAAQANGAWTAPVKLDPANKSVINLVGPAYAQQAAMLGGGSVGLVPFRLHATSCIPAAGSSVVAPSGNQQPIFVQLRHYGPVAFAVEHPLIFERRLAGSANPFFPMDPTEFLVIRDGKDPRTLVVGPAPGRAGFVEGYEYRLRPTEDLRCDIAAAPAVIWENPYTFKVVSPPCPADLSGDGQVNVIDLLILLSHWGAPAQPVAADLNGDGLVNVQDLLILLSSWGVCQ
ncbi:MAG TPA: dockerin type I domain-containing protein [Phycisphaerales bacterium]|nr:dockerin type I domain-containing protein [Phycisphaerales bacterium]HRQ76870.1 dockerin type I domain-containing protein [Phycisphaerales bacterium]